MHAASDAAAGAVEYLPTPHSMQLLSAELPGESLYFPAGHASHDAAETAPLADENVPAVHGVQSVAAALPWYVPASQSWHASAREAPEAWPYFPLAHKTQEAIEPAAVVVENEPLAQGTQESAVDAPNMGE